MSDQARNEHRAALLLIDVMNDFNFDDAEALAVQMEAPSHAISALCGQVRALGIPVVYVNDNFGLWRSEKSAIVEHCRRKAGRHWKIVENLVPQPDDYFVVKPRHSGFFASSLPVLLPDLRARKLILTGVAADICVLFTANDAYMRDYTLWIPSNCVASTSRERRERALDYMGRILKAEIRPTTELAVETWLKSADVSDRFSG